MGAKTLALLFTITVRARGATVPPDTTVHIAWSAADEFYLVLSDPSTWKTLLDEANLRAPSIARKCASSRSAGGRSRPASCGRPG